MTDFFILATAVFGVVVAVRFLTRDWGMGPEGEDHDLKPD